MSQIDELVSQLEADGADVGWLGAASESSIRTLETLLQTRFPNSFRTFLRTYGGGGVCEAVISGIEDDDPMLEYRGTVLGDTRRCRTDFSLPEHLLVIYFCVEEICWCLDTADFVGEECPVVSFDIFLKTTTPLSNSFEEFFVEYLKLRIGRDD